MQKRGGMYNENKFYNIYRLCRKEGAWITRTSSTIYIDWRKEGAWTTRTSSTIYIDYAEKRGHGQREQVLQYI